MNAIPDQADYSNELNKSIKLIYFRGFFETSKT